IEKVEIGDAILYNGPCIEVAAELSKVDHVITDPPYESEAHSEERRSYSAGGGLKSNVLSFAAMTPELRKSVGDTIGRLTNGWALIFCQLEGWQKWRDEMLRVGASPDHPMIWAKPDGKPRYDGTGPASSYEVIELSWLGKERKRWNGGGARGVFNINWNEKRDDGNTHQTVKPQNLMSQ